MAAANPRKDFGMFAMAKEQASPYDQGLVAQAIMDFDGGPNKFIFGWLPPTAADEPPPSFHHQDRALDYALIHLEFGEGRFIPQAFAGNTHAAMGIPALLLGARAQRNSPHNPSGPARFFTPASNYLSYLLTTAPCSQPTGAVGIAGPGSTIYVRAASLFTIPAFLAHCNATLPSPATPLSAAVIHLDATLRALRIPDHPSPLLLDGVCTSCAAGDMTRCRCLRRPSAIATAFAVAGMLRVYALLARQNETDRRARVRVGRLAPTATEVGRMNEAQKLLCDLRALLRAANPTRLWAPFTTRDTLVRTLLDEPCAPPDVAATALFVASALNLKMLVPWAVGEEEVQWAERQFAAVMDWVQRVRVEMRGTEEPQCLTACCVLMMMGAGRNPLLEAIMRRERMLPPVRGRGN